MRRLVFALICLPLLASGAAAGEAEVVAVVAEPESGGTWRFDVTVRHGDEGWNHYADAWEVRAPDGTVLGTRTLLHPHEVEQPFTRSLTGVVIPPGTDTVEVVARDSVHGYGGRTIRVELDPEAEATPVE